MYKWILSTLMALLSLPSYGAFLNDFNPKGPSIAVISLGTFGPITLRHQELFEIIVSELKTTFSGHEVALFIVANDMTLYKRGDKKPLELEHRVNLLKEVYQNHPNIYVLEEPRVGAFARIPRWIRRKSPLTKIFGHVGADSFIGPKNRIGALIMKWASPGSAQVEKWFVTHRTEKEKTDIISQVSTRFAGRPSEFLYAPTALNFDIHATDVRDKYWLFNHGYNIPERLNIPLVSDIVENYIIKEKLFTEERYKPKGLSYCSLVFL